MSDASMKEVNFMKYCIDCKYSSLNERMDPCNWCLEIGMREDTEKPEFFEEGRKK